MIQILVIVLVLTSDNFKKSTNSLIKNINLYFNYLSFGSIIHFIIT